MLAFETLMLGLGTLMLGLRTLMTGRGALRSSARAHGGQPNATQTSLSVLQKSNYGFSSERRDFAACGDLLRNL